MARHILVVVTAALLSALISLSSAPVIHADQAIKPQRAGSPYDLVNAVNAFRSSYGLAPYSMNAVLMYTAQSQADFLAATGTMTHTGPGGSSLTDRLLAAGYPLAGELSAGGFRAENITGGNESMPAESAVNQWTADALHLNTMISPDLTEIGAGVAVNTGRVYYVIDCARPTTSEAPQASTSVAGDRSVIAGEALIAPVVVSTPNPNGDVIHEVQFGQTLWQLAITYNVEIDEIKGLNSLFDNNIYPGTKLLIKIGVRLPTATATGAPISTMTSTPSIAPTSTATGNQRVPTYTASITTSSSPTNNGRIMRAMIGIIALALLGGGLFTWLGNSKK